MDARVLTVLAFEKDETLRREWRGRRYPGAMRRHGLRGLGRGDRRSQRRRRRAFAGPWRKRRLGTEQVRWPAGRQVLRQPRSQADRRCRTHRVRITRIDSES